MKRIPLLMVLASVCTPAMAQIQTPIPPRLEGQQTSQEMYVSVPSIPDSRTPREAMLNSKLAMPGVGLAATKAALEKRMMFAAENDWLSQNQLDELTNELKQVNDREKSLRDEAGSLSLQDKQALASQIYKLNEKFEDFVLSRELAAPGKEGLVARQMFLKQKLQQSIAMGKLPKKKIAELKGQLAEIKDELQTEHLAADKMKLLSSQLSDLGNQIDRSMSSGVAIKGPFSVR